MSLTVCKPMIWRCGMWNRYFSEKGELRYRDNLDIRTSGLIGYWLEKV